MTWNSALPPHHTVWLKTLIDGEMVGESRSTCHDCAMCDKGPANQAGPASGLELTLPGPTTSHFSPQTKCCTYLPELANFLVGATLLEPPSPGRQGVVDRISAGTAVTPLGLGKTPDFQARYSATTFGHDTSLRCPHYLDDEGGKCGVWLHRDAICATYFCHYDRGAISKRFWAATSRFLQLVERGLARWCIEELDLGSQTRDFMRSPTDGEHDRLASLADPSRLEALWGHWWGKQQEYFIACADLVGHLTPEQAVAHAGPQAQLAGQLVADAHAQSLSAEIPEPLIKAEPTLQSTDRGRARLNSYSPLDPVEVPIPLLEALACFDGRHTNTQALDSIRQLHGLEISPELLGDLVDFDLLRRAHSHQQEIADALAAMRQIRQSIVNPTPEP